ncbi:hypothetical protein LWC34_44320 [Kibdelosporangium philippinense]|uniref:Uncharacterized protein n=1 Tax=Kibdelosporangium philippinense TaxID=211113 RepID=A0ABS8ZT55_9PSEU|nr:hypothetical protein [Kibdelosporangium philippinense]MCE7009791.1 hypothetical protein [Kibdelosporangium philippinense]
MVTDIEVEAMTLAPILMSCVAVLTTVTLLLLLRYADAKTKPKGLRITSGVCTVLTFVAGVALIITALTSWIATEHRWMTSRVAGVTGVAPRGQSPSTG